jgi:hypothetical protein
MKELQNGEDQRRNKIKSVRAVYVIFDMIRWRKKGKQNSSVSQGYFAYAIYGPNTVRFARLT